MTTASDRSFGRALALPLRRAVSRQPSDATGREIALRVVRGLHAGAAAELTEPVLTIGSSTQSDIVLKDPGVVSIHARLRRVGGRMEVEAVGGDVVLANGGVVPMGHGRRCKFPVEVSVGEAQLLLTSAGQPPASAPFSLRLAVAFAGLVGLVFLLSVATNDPSLAQADRSASSGGGIAQNLTTLAPSQLGGVAKEAQQNARKSPVDIAAAGDDLRLRLKQAGLDTLNIENAAGRLVVSGAVSKQQADSWTETQSWFDQTYGDRIQLVSGVVTDAAEQAPRLPLRAIWYGQRPYVITTDGGRYYEGAFVGDGWTIKEITEKELLLTKGSSTVALKYP